MGVMPMQKRTCSAMGGDGTWPKGLTQWGPCPSCFGKMKKSPDLRDTLNKIFKTGKLGKYRLPTQFIGSTLRTFSLDTEIETPFHPVFYRELVKKFGEENPLVRDILEKFEELAL